VNVFFELSLIRKAIATISRNKEFPCPQPKKRSRRRSWGRRGRGWSKRRCDKIPVEVA